MKHNDMIAWLAKFDIRFYCKQLVHWGDAHYQLKKKNGIKAINNSSVLGNKNF